MTKKLNTKTINKSAGKIVDASDANNKIPASDEDLRNLIKTSSQDELIKYSKDQLQQIYERAKVSYPESVKKLSRRERENLYFIQEQLFGGIDPKITASLERIGETLVKAPESRKKKINYNLPGNGAVIIKEWKGQRLEIRIIEGGFEYNGGKYKSLSLLAKTISGYAVSGPIFFGLRKSKEKIAQ
jgi:hypothetical protein